MTNTTEHNSYEIKKKRAAISLSEIDPKKPQGAELFNSLARVTVTVGIESVCLRKNKVSGKLEILLTRRSKNCGSHPNLWHIPGSVMRSGEEIEDVFKRLEKNEYKARLFHKKFIGNFNNTKEKRGHVLCMVYLCKTNSGRGVWYELNKLPKQIYLPHKKYVIPMSIKSLRKKS